ncbi:MAG: COX15/CtaA family protein [Deltaproteobacteria bacterium]|nr:COX15/CtaA family protein [Deltaproteobacteria bacterium]
MTDSSPVHVPTAAAPGETPFSRMAWGFLGYLLFVILFGAWVRITGSGAGCGDHWPLCDGQVIPREPSLERMIEYTHRVTSGLCGIFAIGFMAVAARSYGFGHRVSRAALATLLFVIVEGAIGAMLVKLELVAGDTSSARGLVVGLHLGNTLLLTGSAALMAWLAGKGRGFVRGHAPLAEGWFVAVLGGLAITAMTGAVTALGDTLFPVGSEEARSAAGNILVQLRIVHPLVAMGVAGLLVWFGSRLVKAGVQGEARKWTGRIGLLVVVQVIFGFINIGLAAPGWAQLVHLLIAQGLWVCAVIATLAARDAT